MELKNPFGLRNNLIVTIADLTPEEQGRKCNCVCPACGGHFLAAMGEIRQPYFRHDGEPCDSVKAFMTSLYQLLVDALTEKPHFTYPDCYGIFHVLTLPREAAIEDIRANAKFASVYSENAEHLIKGKAFDVKNYVVHKNGKNIPDAIILATDQSQHKLAVVLIPPQTFCKIPNPKPFQGMSTIAIQIEDALNLHHIKSTALKECLRDSPDQKIWISSPKIEGWLHKKLNSQIAFYERCLQQGKEREQEQLIRRQKVCANQERLWLPTADEQRYQRKVQENLEPKLSPAEVKAISQVLSEKFTVIPNEMVKDAQGRRWCFCDECRTWKPAGDMASYGGKGLRINRGICSDCSRNHRRD